MIKKTDLEIQEDQRYKERFEEEYKPRLLIDDVEFQDEYFDNSPLIKNENTKKIFLKHLNFKNLLGKKK